jgi:O-antigen ligase
MTAPMDGRFPELPWVGYIGAITWAIGTNWLGEWYYPLRGIGWLDILFFIWFLFAIVEPKRRLALSEALWEVRKFVLLILVFMTWLLLATTVNCYTWGAGPTDIFAIGRLVYYSAILLFACVTVRQYGYGVLVAGFITGVGVLTLGRFYDAYTEGASAVVLQDLIILKDPNVIGNMMGIGVLFCILGVLKGYVKLSLLAALALAIASVTTFSKGTWLMILFGLLGCMVALLMTVQRSHQSLMRFLPATIVLIALAGLVTYAYWDLLVDLVNLKLQTTEENETAAYRYYFALAAIYAMVDHPIFGLGFRNFPQVERLYPDVVPEPTENAHNAFLHFGAVGGIPALLLLIWLVAYPVAPLWRALAAEHSRALATCLTALVVFILTLSGSVQLQLVAQPFFWLLAGIILSWRDRVLQHTA